MGAPTFEDTEDDTRAAILRATFDALCEHGYANLTIQRIGDTFGMSKSLLYHHYDGKDELLLEFLDYLLSRLERETPRSPTDSPEERLRALLDHLLPEDPSTERVEFLRAMAELRAQAVHDEAYREHFTRSDRFFRAQFVDILEAGIESGHFEPVDVEQVASALTTVATGSMFERVSSDDPGVTPVRAMLESYVETKLRPESDT
ncbi:MAG: TetR/AcrR family transcriptional regulator [Halodesulfurarchaeum sp.]